MAWRRAGSVTRSDLMRTVCRESLLVGGFGGICVVFRLGPEEGGLLLLFIAGNMGAYRASICLDNSPEEPARSRL